MLSVLEAVGLPAFAAGALCLLGILYKYALGDADRRRKLRKDQLDVLVTVLSATPEKSNPMLIEQACAYRFRAYVPYSVLTTLWNVDDPTDAILDYIRGRSFVELDPATGNLVFKTQFVRKWKRLLRWSLYSLGYVVFVFLCTLTLTLAQDVLSNFDPLWLGCAGAFFIYCAVTAVLFLDSISRLRRAERLIGRIERTP